MLLFIVSLILNFLSLTIFNPHKPRQIKLLSLELYFHWTSARKIKPKVKGFRLHREIELMRGIHRLQPVVIVDESHLLDREMLEEVRFLLNFRMDAQSPMALILVGQSELWEKLSLQVYSAIRQRIDF